MRYKALFLILQYSTAPMIRPGIAQSMNHQRLGQSANGGAGARTNVRMNQPAWILLNH